MNDWDFLDEFNKNLLYDYALSLSHERGFRHPDTAIEAKKQTYYLLWFVYRYILGCKTYEDTIPYQTKEILTTYHLKSRLANEMSIGLVDLGDEYGIRINTKDTSETPYLVGFFLKSIYNRLSVIDEIMAYSQKPTVSMSKKAQFKTFIKNIKEKERMVSEKARF